MEMKSALYAAASIASVASYALHAFGGGALMARPFYRKAGAEGISTHAFRYCWHFVSAAVLAMSAGFAFLSTEPGNTPFGLFLTVSAASFCGLSVAVSAIERAPALKSPPTTLFALIAAIGCAALLVK